MINEKLAVQPTLWSLVSGLACCMMALATTVRMARTSCPAWEGEAGLQCSGLPVAASPIQTFLRELPDYQSYSTYCCIQKCLRVFFCPCMLIAMLQQNPSLKVDSKLRYSSQPVDQTPKFLCFSCESYFCWPACQYCCVPAACVPVWVHASSHAYVCEYTHTKK